MWLKEVSCHVFPPLLYLRYRVVLYWPAPLPLCTTLSSVSGVGWYIRVAVNVDQNGGVSRCASDVVNYRKVWSVNRHTLISRPRCRRHRSVGQNRSLYEHHVWIKKQCRHYAYLQHRRIFLWPASLPQCLLLPSTLITFSNIESQFPSHSYDLNHNT